MTDDEFDSLVDNATHAVADLIPKKYLGASGTDARVSVLYEINDALTPILRDLIQSGEEDDE